MSPIASTKRRPPSGHFPGEFTWATHKKDIRYTATGEFRQPLKGEWYLSGAIVTAYQALNDLTTAYWLAKPVQMIKCRYCDGMGKVVGFDV